jgi:NADH:ubiquinone oxidoreductase subunit K
VGGLWAWLAPPIHGVVVLTHSGERLHDYLGSESDHFFVAAFLMLGLLSVVAAVAAVLAWQWRAHRGPGMVVALCMGMVVAAAAAIGVGILLAHIRYGTVDLATVPLSHDHPLHYFTEAAPVFFGTSRLQIACTLLLPAATAALVYAVPAAATSRDDLGGYPPVETVDPQSESATATTS